MAKFEFKLPDIGEGVTEGEIVNWLVQPGDVVAADQDMVEVMTDKATVTIGAPKAGTVAELLGKVGDVIPVGKVLVVLDLGGAAAPAATAPAAAPAAPAAATPKQDTAAAAVGDIKESLPGTGAPAVAAAAVLTDKPLAAPATRKLARELGVDLRTVEPSGKAGRVTKEDVERALAAPALAAPVAAAPAPVVAAPAAPAPASVPKLVAATGAALEERIPIRGMRKRIFENMARSKRTAAHFTYVDECECSELEAFRVRLKPHAEAEGIRLTFLPFIIKAVVAALKKFPALNCLVDDANMEMVRRKTYDIGIATATDNGLIVPVLRNADRLSIVEISKEIQRLAEEARAGKSKPEDLGGSSFTVTSLGKLGGLIATPVVNYPEVAILYVGEMKKKPIIKDDQIAIGKVMNVGVSFDHRIVDGYEGAEFTQGVIALLQNPEKLLLAL